MRQKILLFFPILIVFLLFTILFLSHKLQLKTVDSGVKQNLPTISPKYNQQPDDTVINTRNGNGLWAYILEVKNYNSKKSLVIDYLEENPCWTPGGAPRENCTNIQDFFLNKIPERIEVPLSANAKKFNCIFDADGNMDPGPDNNPTIADTEVPLEIFLNKLNGYKTYVDYYINIKNYELTAIYERCLP